VSNLIRCFRFFFTCSYLYVRAVESDSEGILDGGGIGKNVPTPTSI
jgi:hypothetical protein